MHDTKASELGAAVLRVALGAVFLAHGLAKLLVFTPSGTAEFFASVGFPGWTAYPVLIAEIVGGSLLVVGWQTRWVALAFTPIALGATAVHWSQGWMFTNAGGGWEFPLFLAVACLAQALAGDGSPSLAGRRRPVATAIGEEGSR